MKYWWHEAFYTLCTSRKGHREPPVYFENPLLIVTFKWSVALVNLKSFLLLLPVPSPTFFFLFLCLCLKLPGSALSSITHTPRISSCLKWLLFSFTEFSSSFSAQHKHASPHQESSLLHPCLPWSSCSLHHSSLPWAIAMWLPNKPPWFWSLLLSVSITVASVILKSNLILSLSCLKSFTTSVREILVSSLDFLTWHQDTESNPCLTPCLHLILPSSTYSHLYSRPVEFLAFHCKLSFKVLFCVSLHLCMLPLQFPDFHCSQESFSFLLFPGY